MGMEVTHPVGHFNMATDTNKAWIKFWGLDSFKKNRNIDGYWRNKIPKAKEIGCQRCLEVIELWLSHGKEIKPIYKERIQKLRDEMRRLK
jgi:hypothetical protein